jgi:hypothetical protein
LINVFNVNEWYILPSVALSRGWYTFCKRVWYTSSSCWKGKLK